MKTMPADQRLRIDSPQSVYFFVGGVPGIKGNLPSCPQSRELGKGWAITTSVCLSVTSSELMHAWRYVTDDPQTFFNLLKDDSYTGWRRRRWNFQWRTSAEVLSTQRIRCELLHIQ